jgi:hypothetical protein
MQKKESKEIAKNTITKAHEFAKMGLELDPNNWNCHKWVGITLGLLGDFQSTKTKIQNAFVIR